MDRCAAWRPDLVAITGDIADSPTHHRWILPLLGRLRWNIAAVAILGNHDHYVDVVPIRRRLRRLGMRVPENEWYTLDVRGVPMTIIGTESPWLAPEPDLSECPRGPFRLCLSHTPDNIAWARAEGVDLMLSGHVHGGQVRLGPIGSILVPSAYGRRYDMGTFDESPTLLHVSRGLSGEQPLRLGGLPEVTLLTLRRPEGALRGGLDTAAKTNGSQVYGMDLKLPGLLNAAIRDCPVVGGKVKRYDAAAILQRPGIKAVVPVGDSAVAVVADTWWRAKTALDALTIEWDEGPHAKLNSADIAAMLKAGLDAPEAHVGSQAGQPKEALASAARTLEGLYAYPYQNHACMEVMNATARITLSATGTPERCEVWTPTQNGEAAFAATVAASGLPSAQCEVYKIHLGGGFGRRGSSDWVGQAVAIAKALPGTPVKLIWTREEDMQHGFYHPVTQCKLRAGLDAKGQLTALHMRISGQSILAALLPQALQAGKDPVVFQGLNAGGPEGAFGYAIPNLLIDHAMRNPPIRPGFWRGVNLNHNAIYLECFIDEIAHATNQDPLALRRQLLAGSPKHLAVLEAAAKGAGWGTPAAPVKGQAVHRGLAQIMGFGSYVAACAEVSVNPAGELTVHRIVAATDCGHAVNPQQIQAQVEGSFAYGLSAALFGECTVENGRIQETNFHAYPVLQMAQMPKVETIVMPSGGFWGGVGEPTIAVAAPAVLNAIFAATGQRIRTLPIKRQSLKRA